MKRMIGMFFVITLLCLGIGFALDTPVAPPAQAKLVQLGNHHCPVSGEKVGRMGPPVKFEYKGKIYNLCCPMCIKDFKKNPEKFSKTAEDEVKDAKGK